MQCPALRNHPPSGAAPGCWGGVGVGVGGGGLAHSLSLLFCNKCEECDSWKLGSSAVFPDLATRRRCWVRPGHVGEDDIPERVN